MQISYLRQPSSWPRRENVTRKRSIRLPISSRTGYRILCGAWSSGKSRLARKLYTELKTKKLQKNLVNIFTLKMKKP